MNVVRPYTGVLDRLKAVGLRPTRQRLALAKLLFEGEDRHVTAEQLHSEAHAANIRVSGGGGFLRQLLLWWYPWISIRKASRRSLIFNDLRALGRSGRVMKEIQPK